MIPVMPLLPILAQTAESSDGGSFAEFAVFTLIAYVFVSWLARTIPTKAERSWLPRLIMWGFAVKILGTLARFWMVTVLYGTGDSYVYHLFGTINANVWQAFQVPVGTEVLDEDQETVLIDFTEPGQTVTFLKGGDGGFGNAHYKSSTNQAPRKKTPGWPGVERGIWLRLKLIADAGLVGMPNAGKSTFLAACTAAKPKIADYPFTTLHPNLGVVKAGDKEFVLADIPGLIEGASEGHGLGDRFLGHVERTAVLLHLIDITQDDPWKAYDMVRNELEQYGNSIEDKPEIVALNKADALGEELSQHIAEEFKAHTGITPMVISGVSKEGVNKVLFALNDIIQKTRAGTLDEEE